MTGVETPEGRLIVNDGGVSAEFELDEVPGVETVTPVGRSWTWTRKQGGIAARGRVTLNGRTVEIDAPAIIDDSAGYHPRRTDWRWCSGVGTLTDGRAVAWNFVNGINDTPGASEQTVWVDGSPHEAESPRISTDLSNVAFPSGDRLDFHEEEARSHEREPPDREVALYAASAVSAAAFPRPVRLPGGSASWRPMPPFGETAAPSGPTAQADSPTSLRQGAPAERPPAPKAPRALPDLLLLVGCAAIAWLSLMRPWAVNPDAWHWLRWGDEMRRLTLDTTGTWTSWKPMPSLLAIPISAFHDSAPAIWTVIARTGAVVTVVIGFRLTVTLVTLSSRRDGWLRRVNCVVAGSIAALLLIYLQSGDALSGYSRPVTLALGLAALERAIAGRHIGAFALGFSGVLPGPPGTARTPRTTRHL